MPVWCRVDDLAHLPYEVQKDVAIPKEDGEYVSCKYYYFNYTDFNDSDFINWNRYVKSVQLNIRVTLLVGSWDVGGFK